MLSVGKNMEQKNQIKKIIEKIEEFKTSDKIDLSSKEDLAIAVMNLISIEEHLFFTYSKTGKKSYLQVLNEVRQIRKKYLAEIVKNMEGEIWCISKHLLASSMRLMEVGTKMLNDNKQKEAEDLFEKANSLWNMFWGLNLNLLDIEDVTSEADDKEIILEKGKSISVFGALNKVVKRILDCCRE
jgi:hypothetical protein